MKFSRRILCTVFPFLLIFLLAACGQKEPPAAQSPIPTTDPQVSEPDYFGSAQHFIDVGDIASAVSVLEHALSESEDPRLQILLEELTAPTSLTLDYVNHAEDILLIHSFTAVETYTQTVRYTLNYTAPEGFTVRLSGNLLHFDLPDFCTGGQAGQLVFEANAEDIRSMNGELQVQFIAPEGQIYALDTKTLWPEEIQSSYEISYLHMDHNRTENALVHSFLLTDLGDRYHFTVTYTAVEGLEITGHFETPEDSYSFWDDVFYTEGGDGVLEFDIEKDLFSKGKYMEVCFIDSEGRWVAAGFDFPMRLRRTLETAECECHDIGYSVSNGWGAGFEVHACYFQYLSNGYIRFTLDITAPVGCFVTVFAINGDENNILDQYLSHSDRQQYIFDVPEELLASTGNLSVLVAQPHTRGRYFEIPCGSFAVSSAAIPTGESVQLDFTVMEQPKNPGCEILSASVQPLSNGCLRYTFQIRSDESMNASIFDPPNGENLLFRYLSEPADGIHTLCFDAAPATAAELRELSIICNFSGKQPLSAVFHDPFFDIPPESIPISILSCS